MKTEFKRERKTKREVYIRQISSLLDSFSRLRPSLNSVVLSHFQAASAPDKGLLHLLLLLRLGFGFGSPPACRRTPACPSQVLLMPPEPCPPRLLNSFMIIRGPQPTARPTQGGPTDVGRKGKERGMRPQKGRKWHTWAQRHRLFV